jgi:CRP/FNR family cyclic AMP-dependent transcriptional regulator
VATTVVAVKPGAEFAGLLGAEDRDELERIGRRREADRGDVLLARGDSADHVLVILSGRVKVVVPTPTGSEAVLTFRGPGSLLGDQALVDNSPRSATVVAVEPVELLAVATSAFRGYLGSRPGVALAMLASLSAKLRESDRRLTEFVAADTLGRISARLVELCETQGDADADGPIRITLPITQEELAGWTGSSLESTAKALRSLRSLGWIATGRRAIEVHDLAALRDRAPG